MADVFVSYSRQDTDFVRRIAGSLEGLGKSVWIDTQGIADSEVFPQAIRTAIEGSDAFLFVITPSSVASEFCEQEVDYARALEKRIVPVLLSPVPDPEIPEEIRHRNWIPFTAEVNYEASVERLVRALDTDLERRKDHTRLLVKAIDWDAGGRDRSSLLRGSDLKAAENWIASSASDADPAPTNLQNEYVLASRRAAARRQRGLVVASLAVALVAIGLGVFALVSRNQAVSTERTARAEDLAAESRIEISADPEVSALLAREAVQLLPIPQTVAALRQAMDASAVRLALPTVNGSECGYLGGPSISYSPVGHRVAEGMCGGDVVVVNSDTGRVVFRKHLPEPSGAVSYDPNGRLLAVGLQNGIDLLNPATGAVMYKLMGQGEPNALAFSPDGSLLAATTNQGAALWDVASGTVRHSFRDIIQDQTVAFTSDGRSLVVGTRNGYTAVYDVDSGQMTHELKPPANQQLNPGSPYPIAVGGNILAVGVDLLGPGDLSADIDLWSTKTWTMVKILTPVTGTAIGDLAVSSDGRRVAVGNSDGTGGVWSVDPDEELVPLLGQTADINDMAFSPDGADVATAAVDGTVRIYRATGAWRATLPTQLCSCGNEIGWQPHKLLAVARSGNDIEMQTWLIPSWQLVPGSPVLNTDQANEGVVASEDGRLAATWDEAMMRSPVTVQDGATGRVEFTLPATTVQSVAFSNDDRFLVVIDDSGGLHITNLRTHHTVVGHGWPGAKCQSGGLPPAVNRGDRLVAVYTFCGQVSVGHINDAKPFETFNQHQQLSRIAFNPAGNRLALASWDSTVTVVNVVTDKPVLELIGHSRGVTGVAYTTSGNYIVTTSADDTTRVWSATTGQLMQIDQDGSLVDDPSVSPNGLLVADENSLNQVRIWPICTDCGDPSALLAASRSSVISPLTPLEREAVASPVG